MLKYKQGCADPTIVVVDNGSNKDATIIKVEERDNHRALPLLQALERLLQMQLWVYKYVEYSQTKTSKGMIVQCFEVRDGEGRKVSDENLIANIVKVWSLPMKMEGIIGTSSHSDATPEMYLIQITSKKGCAHVLLECLLVILEEMNFQVYEPRLWSPNRHAMYVKGGSINAVMQHFLEHEAQNIPQSDCKMVLQKLASKDANLDLQNVHYCDLGAP